MDLLPFWEESLKQIERELDQKEFEFWFSQISFLGSQEYDITLQVPSKFYMNQVKARYESLLLGKLKELSGREILLQFEVLNPGTKEQEAQNDEPATEKTVATENSPVPKIQETSTHSQQKSTTTSHLDKKPHTQLNSNYTFETFVPGENDFAFNAAMAISKEPGKDYNPLLIYGGVGMGKTHLMQAIGNRLYYDKEKIRINYVPAETFIHEFIECTKTQTMKEFKKRYRNSDVLLIDDIHDLTRKSGTQEELFNTFNALYDSKKQMVFTCDRPPNELKEFSERLRSRFQMGLVVDLQLPKLESRLAILKKKVQLQGVFISDEVLEYTAKTVTTNVRDLEAALNAVIGYAKLVNQEVTVAMAKNLLKNNFASSVHQNISIDLVQRTVADYFQVTTSDLKAKKRTQKVTLPRQVAMFIIRELTEYSTTEIGLEFGGRDHTTVMHAVQKIEEKMKKDPSLETKIQHLVRSVKETQSKG